MKRFLVILSCIAVPMVVGAQDTSVYSKWKEQYHQQLQSFKDSVTDDYKAFLEQRWKEYELLESEHRQGHGKPTIQPSADSIDHQKPEEIKTQSVPPSPFVPAPIDIHSTQDTLQEVGYAAEIFKVQFYCREVVFRFPPTVSKTNLSGASERQVSKFWKQLDEDNLQNVVSQLRSKQQTLYLNDWGLVDMIRQLSSTVYPGNEDTQTALTVYLLNQMKYDVRLGKMNGNLVMLVTSIQHIYERPYIVINGKKYHALTNESVVPKRPKISTYQQQHPNADYAMDLNMYYAPRIGGCLTKRPYQFTYGNETLKIPVNKALMDFYANYPQTDLFVYANAAVDEAMGFSIVENLSHLTQGKSKVESANVLLQYLQESFKYLTDDIQFNREKTLFCEENFYYGANDCEDRSVLYSYLVRNLLGLDVVLLEYDGHVTTAVCFGDEKIKGYYVKFNGARYMICDPTTKGAKVGQQMRKYRRQTPRLIQLKTNNKNNQL